MPRVKRSSRKVVEPERLFRSGGLVYRLYTGGTPDELPIPIIGKRAPVSRIYPSDMFDSPFLRESNELMSKRLETPALYTRKEAIAIPVPIQTDLFSSKE